MIYVLFINRSVIQMKKYIGSFFIFSFILISVFVNTAYAKNTNDLKNDETVSADSISENSLNVTVLINKMHPLSNDYSFTKAPVPARKGYMFVDERAAEAYLKMMEDAKEDGIDLLVISAFRDISRQRNNFNRKVLSYRKDKDLSYLEAYSEAAMEITIPGTSEHEAGLAMDIACKTYTGLNEGFADTDAGKWLKDNAYKYGFILRYPKGKEYITGIEFEPWHFRYVGIEAAKEIYNKNWTLEEYVRAH